MIDNLVVCIITLNEERHLERCIINAQKVSSDILVVDSGSTDDTELITRNNNGFFVYNEFVDYGSQRLFAMETAIDMGFEWMLFLDADEYLTEELINEINSIGDTSVSGFILKRRFIWNDKWIRYGGYYPTRLLRLFKLKNAFITRQINEHIQVQGITRELEHDFVDHNLGGIEYWVGKHNKYSSLEAESWIKDGNDGVNIQLRILRKLPLLLQPFVYFFYRVVVRGGFRDGMHAVWYHYLHAFLMFGLTSYKYKIRSDVRNSRFYK